VTCGLSPQLLCLNPLLKRSSIPRPRPDVPCLQRCSHSLLRPHESNFVATALCPRRHRRRRCKSREFSPSGFIIFQVTLEHKSTLSWVPLTRQLFHRPRTSPNTTLGDGIVLWVALPGQLYHRAKRVALSPLAHRLYFRSSTNALHPPAMESKLTSLLFTRDDRLESDIMMHPKMRHTVIDWWN